MAPPRKMAALVVVVAAGFVIPGVWLAAAQPPAWAAQAPPTKKPATNSPNEHKGRDYVGRADQKRDRQHLYSFESGAYKITTDVDKDLANDIAAHMDEVFKEYANRFGRAGFRPNPWAAVKPNQKMPLYVLRRYKDYLAFLNDFGVKANNTGGVFFRTPEKESGLATWVQGQSRLQMYYTLQHEGFHQFADSRIALGLPPWVNEGIADYFGEAVMVDGKLRIGLLDRERLERIRRAVKNKETLPFRELMTMSNDAWIKRVNAGDKSSTLMYDSAWSVCYFLIHGRHGGPLQTTVRGRTVDALEAYLLILNDEFVKNPARDAKPAAFKEVFSNNLDNFERAWTENLKELKGDPWLSSVRHVQILATAFKQLRAKHIEITSLQQIEDRLRKDLFHDVPSPATAELIPSEDDDFPPGMEVTGVTPAIRLSWAKDAAGDLEEQITFERRPPSKTPGHPPSSITAQRSPGVEKPVSPSK